MVLRAARSEGAADGTGVGMAETFTRHGQSRLQFVLSGGLITSHSYPVYCEDSLMIEDNRV